MTTEERYCPVCLHGGVPTKLIRLGDAWICPVQQDEQRLYLSITMPARYRAQKVAQERVKGLPF